MPETSINQSLPEMSGLLRAATPLQQSFDVTATTTTQCTAGVNVLTADYSFLVVNTGLIPALAYLQVSPDNTTWQTETDQKTIAPGTVVSFVPDTIAKYTRLCYQTQSSSTTLTIYLQGRFI